MFCRKLSRGCELYRQCVAVAHGRLVAEWRRPLTSQASKREVTVEEGMTVSQLAQRLRTSPRLVFKVLQKVGERVKHRNSLLPLELSELVVLEMGHTPLLPGVKEVTHQPRDPSVLRPRPPVVTVMGHVDHGKTTLLDSLRQTSVAAGEPGGITQHIGAFSVLLGSGHRLTFLDTPGHAAFTAMRARGADVTDIVVLVVAADDGVLEQTRECIALTQQARVPLVVAINKCDKGGVNVPRVKHELLQHGVQLEEFGGEVQGVEVSALKGTGLDALEEAIVTQAELCTLQGDPGGGVEGVVIETRVDKGFGPVATLIVQHGTLSNGDVLVAGSSWARVRAMFNEHRQPVKSAPPSTPVLTAGWRDTPTAGDECIQVESEQQAREVASFRAVVTRRRREWGKRRRGEEVAEEEEGEGGRLRVPVVVKGDVAGSVEALVGVLSSRQPEQVGINVIHSGVGPVTDNDVEMAASAEGVVLAFNVSCTKITASLAKQREVSVLTHSVIYRLLELLKTFLQSRLPPVWEEEVEGEAEVLKVFKLRGSKAAVVGGCRVKQGRLTRKGQYRLLRGGEVVHEGPLVGMKHEKDDIEVAKKETECGVSFSVDPGFQEGDRIQCFTHRKVPQQLHWNLGF